MPDHVEADLEETRLHQFIAARLMRSKDRNSARAERLEGGDHRSRFHRDDGALRQIHLQLVGCRDVPQNVSSAIPMTIGTNS